MLQLESGKKIVQPVHDLYPLEVNPYFKPGNQKSQSSNTTQYQPEVKESPVSDDFDDIQFIECKILDVNNDDHLDADTEFDIISIECKKVIE